MSGRTGMGMRMDPRQIAQLMRNPSGVAEMLQQSGEGEDSPAEIFADVINVQRADVRRLAALHGVEVDVDLMSPDRAAELLAGTVVGDGVELVVAFNKLAAKRDQILREALSDAEYQQFMEAKTSVMHTSDPDTFEGEAEE